MVSALIPQFSSGPRVRNINFPFQRAAFSSKMSIQASDEYRKS